MNQKMVTSRNGKKERTKVMEMGTVEMVEMVMVVVGHEEENPECRREGTTPNSKKHSDLYTDENPKGTIDGLGFKDVETSHKSSVSKIKKVKSLTNSRKRQRRLTTNFTEMGKTLMTR